MPLGPVLRTAAADLADRLGDLPRLQVAAAPLVALVAPGGGSAVGADPLDVPIGEEPVAGGTVGELDLPGIDVPLLHQSLDDRLGPAVVGRVVGVSEVVELHPHPPKYLVKVVVVSGHQLRRRRSPLLGVDDDGSSMGVGSADEEGFFSHLLQPPDVDVGGDVGPEVADVTGAVGIGQSTGYEYGKFGWSQIRTPAGAMPKLPDIRFPSQKGEGDGSGRSPQPRRAFLIHHIGIYRALPLSSRRPPGS